MLTLSDLLLAVVAFLPATAGVADVEDGWHNLRRVTHDRGYTVVFRDGQCTHGRLSSGGDQTIAFEFQPGQVRVIRRSEVLRISDNPSAPAHDAVFSARSSWTDLKDAKPQATEYLHIVTKRGEELKWKPAAISDDSVAFEGRTLAKADVRYVSYVRFKPLTTTEEYIHQESADLLAPRLWFHSLMLGKISVLFYNSDLPEDNSPLECKNPLYRGGYFDETPETAAKNALQLALNDRTERTEIPVTAIADRSDNLVRLEVWVDANGILWTQKADRWKSDIQILVRFASNDGKQTGQILSQEIALKLLPESHTIALSNGLLKHIVLKVPTGAASVRVIVLDRGSGKVGTSSIPLAPPHL